jgi:hypothetical protein
MRRSVYVVIGASSVIRMAFMMVSRILVVALNLVRLKSRLSILVFRHTPSLNVPKACFNSKEIKMPKGGGAFVYPTLDVEY